MKNIVMMFVVQIHGTEGLYWNRGEDVSTEENPRVFLDISINGRPAAERIEIELFANVVPKTAENFLHREVLSRRNKMAEVGKASMEDVFQV
ncbi:hypothetical protein L1987_74545 [Smallanthus sonchifolius]|uniref:Uncharacterized protein n=1 Tax=Smallanthus sonchifolius TaxID=185202 RepID=A0ACB9A2I3_9ASTR|nr:hypothetical protein L1987_74545 [Smallanthus sonchifolius]